MKIIEEKDNFLMNRKEVKVVVEAGKNPSYDEALNLISEKFKIVPELVVIKSVKGKFGRNTFLISAFIYKSKEDKERFERKKKEKKAIQETTATEQPAQEKKEKAKEKEENKQ